MERDGGRERKKHGMETELAECAGRCGGGGRERARRDGREGGVAVFALTLNIFQRLALVTCLGNLPETSQLAFRDLAWPSLTELSQAASSLHSIVGFTHLRFFAHQQP